MAKAMREPLSALFHWKSPGVLIVCFIAVGIAVEQLGQGAHFRWLVNLAFIVSYLFFLLAVIWSLGSWLSSEFLQGKNRHKNPWDNPSHTPYRTWKWGASSGIFAVFVFAIVVTALFHRDKISTTPITSPQAKSEPKPQSEASQTPTPARKNGTPCKYALEFIQVEIPNILGSPFGQRVTVIPKTINDQVFPFVRFTATEHITGGEGIGVMVRPDTGDPQAAGISLASGHLGVMVEKDGSAELWLSDPQKFAHSKAVVVQLYGPKRFEVMCAEQPPIPPTQYITIPNAGSTKSPAPTPTPKKRHTPQQTPAVPVEHVHVVGSETVHSPYDDAPFGLKIVIGTDIAIQNPIILSVECDRPLTSPVLRPGGNASIWQAIPIDDQEKIWQWRVDYPPLTPESPWVAIVFSHEFARCTKVKWSH